MNTGQAPALAPEIFYFENAKRYQSRGWWAAGGLWFGTEEAMRTYFAGATLIPAPPGMPEPVFHHVDEEEEF
jgi:hypothetical protein